MVFYIYFFNIIINIFWLCVNGKDRQIENQNVPVQSQNNQLALYFILKSLTVISV